MSSSEDTSASTSSTPTSPADAPTKSTTAIFLVLLEKMGASIRKSRMKLSVRFRENQQAAPKSPKPDVWRGTSYLPYGMETPTEAEQAFEMASLGR
ncbi:uncharacterized protein PV07_01143 [Cladophialophora immunda]|uniref:Uncharacterized protein n=1 Tax=Cladophialophora immunda TaxID=569365 RepID=A0A0D2DF76_9EURO|nr:uncharacterized protein PV07_01143 [Cladophialophora immunda]KIW34364.1 hypothetical protein PV07_01143 [Cladophialophora immunda]